MTGAEIDRLDAGSRTVLAIRGSFDGASAWELRNEMDESEALDFVVDLRGALEACDFAAVVLAAWQRGQGRRKRVRFYTDCPEHARLLAAHGLECFGAPASTWREVVGATPAGASSGTQDAVA